MTGDSSQLTNFIHKFLDTVKFGNDQIAKIIRDGDYQIGNIAISRVYYVEGLGHNLFPVGQFCDSDLKVSFRKHTKKYILVIMDDYSRFTWVKYLASKDEALDFIIKFLKMIQVRLSAPVRNIRIDNGTEFLNQTLHRYYESLVPVAVAPRAIDLADLPVSTLINQDDPSINLTSQGSSSNVRPIHTLFESLGRWMKDHPIGNVIKDPSRSVYTRKQLQTDVMWCYFDAFLTTVEPKNFKQAMTEPSWIDAIQEEIHEFKRLKVWLFVSCLDKVILIKLKWIYKVKTDEFGGILKNKARLAAQGFRQEEGINFEESFALVDTGMSLTAYADADHVGCQDTRRSTSGIAQFLGDKLCNVRINLGMKPKESTYHVVFDALALTACYLPFLITAEVLVICMHQFWATVDKHKASYRFKINNKRFSMNVEAFGDIFNICLRIWGQEFDEPPIEEEALSFICELGAEPPKSKKPKMKSDSVISSEENPSKKKPTKAKKDVPSKKKPASKPQPTKKVPNEQQRKTSGTDEGTGTKLGVSNVPKYLSKSENESWGDSGDDENNDDNSDEVTKDDDEDDVESDANDDKEAKEEKEEEDVRTHDSFEFNDDDDEEYDELYKDVNVRSKVAKHEELEKRDAKMIDTTHESSKQISSVSSDFASKFLNLDNVPTVVDKVASMMNVKTPHEELSTQAPLNLSVPMMAIPKTLIIHATTITLIIQPFFSIPLMTTPTSVPTTDPTTSSILALLDFASFFGFDQRVSALEQDLSQVKQVDHSTQILTQIPIIVDEHLSTRIRFVTQIALQSYMTEFKKKAQAKKEKYIDIIEISVKEIIKDEVKSQLSLILPKVISDFATPVIQSIINESLENTILAKSSSQLQSTYEAATSLTEFELKKILLDKLEKSKSYRAAEQHRDLYDALVKPYHLEKELFV
uniref:Integrase catalytic domain-containing protein n=1 Tax=Tanacetum cinerariifolium TaxID=118510 RepID=A0A699HFW4_TANCI|nr:hypothetical protein [Tanacetum cinerariifolium]